MTYRRPDDTLVIAANQHTVEREYWLKQLSGELVKIRFPYDFKKNKSKAGKEQVDFVLENELYSALMKMSNNSDFALNMILLAALVVLLNKYTGNQDIIVGAPIYKQESESDFINTLLALRVRLNENETFKDLLLRVKEIVSDADEYQNYPIEVLLTQLDLDGVSDKDESPLFDILLMLENIHHAQYNRQVEPGTVISFNRTGTRIEGSFRFNAALYDRATIRQIIDRFKLLLQAACLNPEVNIGDIDLLVEGERERLLMEFNDTATDFPADRTIAELFQECVHLYPHRTAAVGPGLRPVGSGVSAVYHISYLELNRDSNHLARQLRNKGVQADNIVGLLVDRSIEMMIGIMGILKSGAAYLPMEPDYPAERMKYMLHDADARIMVTEEKYLDTCKTLFDGETVNLQEPGQEELDDYCWQDLESINQSFHLAYIIYTSGTTGKPKGNMTSHCNAVRVVKETNYIRLDVNDRLLQLSNYAFDGSVFDIYGALLNGGALVLLQPGTAAEVDKVAELIKREQVTVFFVTTALFNMLVEFRLTDLKDTRKILFGGERVSVEHSRRALDFLGKDRVVHVYGPTEATVYASYYPIKGIEDHALTIPIGKPLANTSIYILDPALKLVPVGISGELYIGGEGVARGYLNRPELTAERFVIGQLSLVNSDPNDQCPMTNDRLYRTGDLARWLADGNIEFLGRIDNQVKVRGFRIELGEIESYLLNHPQIEEALVIARESEKEGGDRYLSAYFVSSTNISTRELREYLANELPAYMIPAYFTRLVKMPLNANGKIDLHALPEPEAGDDGTYTPPRTMEEKQLTGIWSSILEIPAERIGIDADFFEIGGHSLKATNLVHRVYKVFEVGIEIADVFTYPTIRELAARLKELAPLKYIDIAPAEEKEYYPISAAQKGLFIEQYREQESTIYNSPFTFKLEGMLRLEDMERAMKQMTARHEALRTSFLLVRHEPVQRVAKQVEFAIRCFDAGETYSDILDGFIRPFDLSKAPLLRMGLLKTGETGHILIFDMHHIIMDGLSVKVFFEELVQLYGNSGGEPLADLRIQYKDFAQWQKRRKEGEEFKQQEHYWLDEFKGDIPPMNLPLDYRRPEIQDFEGCRYRFEVDSAAARALNRLAVSEDVTMFMVLLSIFFILLSRICDQEDVRVGTPVYGRRHEELDCVIGHFVNMLVLRTRTGGKQTFRRFLAQVKSKILPAFDNQDYPFEDLVERVLPYREANRNPLFDVVYVFQNNAILTQPIPDINIPGLKLELYDFQSARSPFDMILATYEIGDRPKKGEKGDRLEFVLHYKTALFNEETVKGIAENYLEIVAAVVEDSDIPLQDIVISHDLLAASTPAAHEDEGDFGF
jgi:amino acid adenylation domain-containing protein